MNIYREQRGFITTEVLVSFAILTMSLVGFLTLLNFSYNDATSSRMQTYATALATKSLERIRAMPYDQIGVRGKNLDGTLPVSEQVTTEHKTFSISYQVDWVDSPVDGKYPSDTNPRDYKRVTVRVSWTAPVASSLTLSTDIMKRNQPPDVAFSDGYPKAADSYSEIVDLEEGVLVLKPLTAPVPEGHHYAQCLLQAQATDSDGWIDTMRFWIGGEVVQTYEPLGTPQTYTNFPNYEWDTERIPPEIGEGAYSDGSYSVRVEAVDNETARNYEDYEVIVDNYRPPTPTNLTLDTTSPTLGQTDVSVSFKPGLDGADTPMAYRIYRDSALIKVIDLREEETDYEVLEEVDPNTGEITTIIIYHDANRPPGTYRYEVESVSWVKKDDAGAIVDEGWTSASKATGSITTP